MAGTLAALSSAKLLAPLIGGVVVFGAGFAASEFYEHRAPWGLSAQLASAKAAVASATLTGEKAGAAEQSATDASAFAQWKASLATCQAQVVQDRNTAASAISAQNKFTSAQASRAYALGRATCENPNAKAGPSGAAQPSGVPNGDSDFSGLFNAAAPASP